MFGRKKTPKAPNYVVSQDGDRPSAASPIEDRETETWIAGWPTELALISEDGEKTFHPWSDFSTGTWDDDTNLLTLTFVDPRKDDLVLKLPREGDDLIITMVRERIDRSIIHQQFEKLPSGGTARGQVRRNADESLFTQIIVDTDITDQDMPVLTKLENELREVVGLPII